MGYAFISYSSKNQTSADALRELLKRKNIATWMAPYDIPLGSKYAQVISRAVKECSCFLLLLSNDSQNSYWVAREVERAINYRKPLIPVQIEDFIINDEFEIYISTDQMIAINKIDEDSTEIIKLISGIAAYTDYTYDNSDSYHSSVTSSPDKSSQVEPSMSSVSSVNNATSPQEDQKQPSDPALNSTSAAIKGDSAKKEAYLEHPTIHSTTSYTSTIPVTLPENPPIVKELTFCDCKDLERKNGNSSDRFIIPDVYTGITEHALEAIHVDKLYIPSSVSYIHRNCFINAKWSINKIYLHHDNKYFTITLKGLVNNITNTAIPIYGNMRLFSY